MNRSSFILILGAALPGFGQKKKQQLRDAEIEVLEAAVKSEEGHITIDARLKNTGEKQARNLVIFYDVLDSDRNVLTRQRGGIEQKDLDPEDETEVQAQIHFHARAVSVRFEFEDGSGRNFKGKKRWPVQY